MMKKDAESLLRETKAILEGHFLLTSGLHSPLYVEKFNVLQHPEYTEKLCEMIADHFRNQGVQTVIGPATGGIILSQVTARLLGTRSIFTERENGKMTLRRGSGGKADYGVPADKVFPLVRLTVPAYRPEECPLCKKGVPITERGSHHLKK